MKLRIIPIVITFVVSAVLLFGGFFLYRQMAVQDPLEKMVLNYEGVTNAQIDIKQDTINLTLGLKPDTDVRGLVQKLQTSGRSLLGKRTLKLEVKDQTSPAIDRLWSKALFPVAQAMENRQYTEIPKALNKLVEAGSKVKAEAQMDETNVYISLTDGQATKHIILPRVPQTLEVWNHAQVD